MKKFIYLCLMFCGSTSLLAAEKLEYRGYSGSMFVHSGKLSSKSFEVTNKYNPEQTSTHQINNMEFGLGGKVALQFGKYLRFGMEGYNSTTTYGDYKSTFSAGWGGLLADFLIVDRLISYFAGATLGGGRAVNTVVTEEQKFNFETSDILRRRYNFGMIAPFCGTEVRVNDRVRIALKADYMLRFVGYSNHLHIASMPKDWGRGFRVYLGVTFRSQN